MGEAKRRSTASAAFTKDELSLAEWPIGVLSDYAPAGVKTLTFSDSVRLPEGGVIRRSWTVSGSDEAGLPTASDEPVFLALMEIAKAEGFKTPKVEFTAYGILSRLGLPDNGKSYDRLRKSLLRLTGVTISADSAFYDVSRKRYRSTVAFHILDSFSLLGEAGSRTKSYVRFSEELWSSVQSGGIKSLDFDAYLSLSGAVSRRLYRYLDKHSYDGKKTYSIGLGKLAFEHLAMPRAYYPSQVKRLLEKAHLELNGMGFLTTAEYRDGKEGEIVTYRFGKARRAKRESLRTPSSGTPRSRRSEGHREASPPVRVLDVPQTPLLLSEEEEAALKSAIGDEALEEMRERITVEVMSRPLFAGKTSRKGIQAIVAGLLREELAKSHGQTRASS